MAADFSGRQVVTALFDSVDDANEAISRLRDEGVASTDIRLVQGSTETAAAEPAHDKGFWETLGDLLMPDEDRYSYAEGLRRGGYLVSVTTSAADRERVLDILDDEGTVNLDEREESWRSEGWSGYPVQSPLGSAGTSAGVSGTTGFSESQYDATSGRSSTTTSGIAGGGSLAAGSGRSDYVSSSATTPAGEFGTGRDKIDVVEERLNVGKRDVSHGRVRVRSYVVEEPVTEQIGLREERVDIERRPVDRTLSGTADPFIDQTIELEETRQVPVVSKTARVTEEISLNREVSERTETISDSVRRTEVEIEDERSEADLLRETGTVRSRDL